MSTYSLPYNVYSSKQKHYILLKYFPASPGVTLYVDIPVTGLLLQNQKIKKNVNIIIIIKLYYVKVLYALFKSNKIKVHLKKASKWIHKKMNSLFM